MSTPGNSPRTDRMRRSTSSTSQGSSNWSGYEWNVPLDEIIDCQKCPGWCQRCYGYGKARPKWQKALIVCLYLALLDISLAMLFRFSVYSDIEFYLGVKDQRIIGRVDDAYNLSPGLCSDYHLRQADGGNDDALFNAFVLPGYPTQNRDPSDYQLSEQNVPLPVGEVFIMYHYMGASATVTLSTCAPDRLIYLYAVRSTSSIGQWENNKCCGHYSEKFIFHKCNRDGSPPDSVMYSARDGYKGDLFFVLMNDPYQDIPAKLKPLNITSTLRRYDYDWSHEHPSDSCEVTSDCWLNLEGAHSVAVELSNVTRGYTKLQATCVASVWSYTLYFGIIPLSVVSAIAFIAMVLYGLQMQVNRLAEEGDRERAVARGGGRIQSAARTGRRRAQSSSLRSPLVRNEVHQTQVGDPPPSYDSVAIATVSESTDAEEPPPSYSSLTGLTDVV